MTKKVYQIKMQKQKQKNPKQVSENPDKFGEIAKKNQWINLRLKRW